MSVWSGGPNLVAFLMSQPPMTPRHEPLAIGALWIVACAARSAAVEHSDRRAPRASITANVVRDAALDRSQDAGANDAAATNGVFPARCERAGFVIASPAPELEFECPWGVPACDHDVNVVLRNCRRAPVRVLRAGATTDHIEWDFDPEHIGTLEPDTETRLPLRIPGRVGVVHVRVELAQGDGGAPEVFTRDVALHERARIPAGAGAELGAAAPTVLVAAAPDGRWAVVCQSPRDTNGDGELAVHYGMHGDTYGDALTPFFLGDRGVVEAIDDFVGADATGRFVALITHRHLVLRDTARNADAELVTGSDPPDPSEVSFDAAGRRMAYVRRVGARSTVVVRELATAREVEIDPGPGVFRSAHLDPEGAWVVVRVLAHDTNHDGRLSAPRVTTTLGPRRCRGPVSSYSAYHSGGDEPETLVAPASGGAAATVPGLLRPLGDSLLVRAPDGALALVDAYGARLTLVPAACGGRVVDGFAPRRQVTVGCANRAHDGSMPMEFYEPGQRQTTGVLLPERSPPVDALDWPWRGASVRYLSEAQTTFLVDRENRVAHPFPSNHEVQWVAGAGVLIVTPEGAALFNPSTNASVPLRFETQSWRYPEGRGATVWYGGLLLNVAQGRRLGRFDGEALAATTDGRVLIPAASFASARRAPMGPLRWVPATP